MSETSLIGAGSGAAPPATEAASSPPPSVSTPATAIPPVTAMSPVIPACGVQAKRRYELRVASVLGPGLVSSFGHTAAAHAVSSHTLYQFCVPGDRDLIAILRLLRHCGVECVAIRQAAPACAGIG